MSEDKTNMLVYETLGSALDQTSCNTLCRVIGNQPANTLVSLGDIAVLCGAQEALQCVYPPLIVNRNIPKLISLVIPSIKRAAQYTKDVRIHQAFTIIDSYIETNDIDLINLNVLLRKIIAETQNIPDIPASDVAVYALWTAVQFIEDPDTFTNLSFLANALAHAEAVLYDSYCENDNDKASRVYYLIDNPDERRQQILDICKIYPPVFVSRHITDLSCCLGT